MGRRGDRGCRARPLLRLPIIGHAQAVLSNAAKASDRFWVRQRRGVDCETIRFRRRIQSGAWTYSRYGLDGLPCALRYYRASGAREEPRPAWWRPHVVSYLARGRTLRKHPRPFFASEEELKTWDDYGGNENSLFAPTIEVTREKLFSAIQEAETVADWIEGRMEKAWEWRRNAGSE